MKKFSEYDEVKRDELYDDIVLSYRLRHMTILYESLADFCESLGMFKNCDVIAQKILDTVKNTDGQTFVLGRDDFNVGRLFFKKCFVEVFLDTIEDEDDECNYSVNTKDYKNSDDVLKWDDEHHEFNFIEIEIHTNRRERIDEVYDLLIHELQHAWNDYQTFLHGTKPQINRLHDYQYGKIVRENPDDHDFLKFFKQTYYFLNEFEQGSYIAQINGVLRDKKFSKMKDALDEFKKHALYNQVFNTKRNVDYVLSSAKLSDLWCQVYNKMFNKNHSRSKILNELAKKSHRFVNKFVNHLCAYLEKHVEVSTLPASHRRITRKLSENFENIVKHEDLFS